MVIQSERDLSGHLHPNLLLKVGSALMSETLTQGFIQSDFEIYQGGDRKTCSISITSIRAEQR